LNAIKCLDKVKKSDMVELQSMSSPPIEVRLTLEALCVIFSIKPDEINDPNNPRKKIKDYVGPARKHLLSQKQLLEKMRIYNRDNVPENVVQDLTSILSHRRFMPDRIAKHSKACSAICVWIQAIYAYRQRIDLSELQPAIRRKDRKIGKTKKGAQMKGTKGAKGKKVKKSTELEKSKVETNKIQQQAEDVSKEKVFPEKFSKSSKVEKISLDTNKVQQQTENNKPSTGNATRRKSGKRKQIYGFPTK